MHRLETLRDRLLDDDEALTRLLENNPQADVQHLRAVIRAARKEKQANAALLQGQEPQRSSTGRCSRRSRPSSTDSIHDRHDRPARLHRDRNRPNPTHAVIWLHGLGADGNDFAPIVPELDLPAGSKVRFVFPNAPVQPVTINNGMAMRSWYDILVMDLVRVEDGAGIRRSEAEIHKLIARENARGIPTSNIVLAGFSQGCAMTLHTGLRLPEKLAGMMGLSGYLPLLDTAEAERHGANARTPIFLAHGTFDPVAGARQGHAGRAAAPGLRRALAHLWHAAFRVRRGSGRHLALPARSAELSKSTTAPDTPPAAYKRCPIGAARSRLRRSVAAPLGSAQRFGETKPQPDPPHGRIFRVGIIGETQAGHQRQHGRLVDSTSPSMYSSPCSRAASISADIS